MHGDGGFDVESKHDLGITRLFLEESVYRRGREAEDRRQKELELEC